MSDIEILRKLAEEHVLNSKKNKNDVLDYLKDREDVKDIIDEIIEEILEEK